MLAKDANGVVAAVTGCTVAHLFDPISSDFAPRHGQKEVFAYDAINAEYTLKDTTGNVLKFHDFGAGLPAAQKGQFKSLTTPTATSPPSPAAMAMASRPRFSAAPAWAGQRLPKAIFSPTTRAATTRGSSPTSPSAAR